MDPVMQSLLIFVLGTVPGLLGGGYLGYRIFSKRFYNAGYDDGHGDAAQHGQVSGECAECGWEPPYGGMSVMLNALLNHIQNDCPAKRY